MEPGNFANVDVTNLSVRIGRRCLQAVSNDGGASVAGHSASVLVNSLSDIVISRRKLQVYRILDELKRAVSQLHGDEIRGFRLRTQCSTAYPVCLPRIGTTLIRSAVNIIKFLCFLSTLEPRQPM